MHEHLLLSLVLLTFSFTLSYSQKPTLQQLAAVPLRVYFANHTLIADVPPRLFVYNSDNVGYYVAGNPNAPIILELGVPYGGSGVDGVQIICAQAAREFVATAGSNYAVVVRWMGWGGVGGAPLAPCNATGRTVEDHCPDVIMMGTTQIAGRVKTGDIVPLSRYMDLLFQQTGRFIQDDMRRGTYYDYFLKDQWWAIPVISDVRILAVNTTAFNAHNISPPPPVNGSIFSNTLGGNWTWEALTDAVLNVNVKTGGQFTMMQDYQEGLKTLSLLMRSARVSMFNISDGIDGGCGYKNPKFLDLFNRTFVQMKKANAFTYCQSNDGDIPSCDSDQVKAVRLSGISILPVQWFFEWRKLAADPETIQPAYVPGFTTFLGGSGLTITRITHRGYDAWRLMSVIFDASNEYISELGFASSSPPPYESISKLPEWNIPKWKVVLDVLPVAVPEQWPEQTFPELSAVEGQALDKEFMMNTLFKNMPLAEAGAMACAGFERAFAKECTKNDFAYKVGNCSASNTLDITFYWKQPKICVNKTMLGDFGVELPTTFALECPYVHSSSALAIGIFSFSAIGLLASIILGLGLYWYSDTLTIKASSPLFNKLTLLGSDLIYISTILQAGDPRYMGCTVSTWVFVFGFALTFGSLFVKIFRIYCIFTNKKGNVIIIDNKHLLMYLGIILVLETAVLVAYEVSPGHPVVTSAFKEIAGVGMVELFSCSSPNPLITLALIFVNLILLICTCALSFLCRHVPPQYQEAKVVSIIVYAASFILIVIVPVLIYISSSGLVQIPFLLFGLAADFTTLSSMIIFCGTKIYRAYLEKTGKITVTTTTMSKTSDTSNPANMLSGGSQSVLGRGTTASALKLNKTTK